MPIRIKISLLFSIIVSGLVAIFSIYVYYLSGSYRQTEFITRLRDKANTSAHLLVEVEQRNRELMRVIENHNMMTLPEERVLVYDAKNHLLWDSSPTQGPQPFRTALLDSIRRIQRQSGHEAIFVYGEREAVGVHSIFKQNDLVVIAMAYDRFGFSKLANLRLVLIGGGAICLLLIAGISWFFAGRVVRPLQDIVQQIDNISFSNLSVRVAEGRSNDEIAQLARKFNEMLERLEEAFENQRSFVSHASHEMRTPLTSLKGRIEVAMLRNYAPDELRALLPELLAELNNLNRLTTGLLELANLSERPDAIHSKTVELDSVVLESCHEVERRMPDSRLEVAFAPQLDLAETPLETQGDPDMLRTVFLNLVENACKFSKGKPVRVSFNVRGQWLVVQVQDHGPGIAENELRRIFEPFFRTQSALGIRGHGIGLSLAQKIVELHGGTIGVQSALGLGSTFTVQLPRMG